MFERDTHGVEINAADGTVIPAGPSGDHGGRRCPGRVIDLTWDDDHGEPGLVHITFEDDAGRGIQGFGGLYLPPDGTAALLIAAAIVLGRAAALRERSGDTAAITARVASRNADQRRAISSAFQGARGFALRPTGQHGDLIEGLEGPAGDRLTLTGFLQARGFSEPGTHARAEARLTRKIGWARARLEQLEVELAGLGSVHVAWASTIPGS